MSINTTQNVKQSNSQLTTGNQRSSTGTQQLGPGIQPTGTGIQPTGTGSQRHSTGNLGSKQIAVQSTTPGTGTSGTVATGGTQVTNSTAPPNKKATSNSNVVATQGSAPVIAASGTNNQSTAQPTGPPPEPNSTAPLKNTTSNSNLGTIKSSSPPSGAPGTNPIPQICANKDTGYTIPPIQPDLEAYVAREIEKMTLQLTNLCKVCLKRNYVPERLLKIIKNICERFFATSQYLQSLNFLSPRQTDLRYRIDTKLEAMRKEIAKLRNMAKEYRVVDKCYKDHVCRDMQNFFLRL